MPSMLLPLEPPVIFQVDSYCSPPRGQKSQQSEQPVHILTSCGRSSSPMPIESVGQAATHTPQCTQRSASITAFSRSQNQTLPGASSTSFIISLMSKPATIDQPCSRPACAAPRAVRRSACAWPTRGSARPLAAETYIPDLGLRAGGRAAREVHPHRLLARIPNSLVHLAGPLQGPDLGLDDAEAAELASRTGHDATLERPRLRGVPCQKGLGQKFIEPALGNARKDQVLVRSESDPVPVLPGEPTSLLELLPAHPPNRHVQADVVKGGSRTTLTLLGVDADVIPAVPLRQVLCGGCEPHGNALRELFAEALRTELLDQVAHPRRPAVLPVPKLAEDLGYAAGDLHCIFGSDEHVDIRGHPRAVGEAAANAKIEAHSAVFHSGREHAYVVDLGLCAVLQASRDAHLELPRQVRVLAVTGKVGGDSLRHGVGIYSLLVAEARDRATQHVAGRVAAGLHGRDAGLFQAAPDLGYVLHLDPVHLYVLARGQIEEVVSEVRVGHRAPREVGRYLAYDPGLLGRQDAARDFDPHHERVAALLLRV